MKKRCLATFLLIAAALTINAHQTEFPKLTGPYLGQKPPGMTLEVFAPEIVSYDLDEHRSPTISLDLSVTYWLFQRIGIS